MQVVVTCSDRSDRVSGQQSQCAVVVVVVSQSIIDTYKHREMETKVARYSLSLPKTDASVAKNGGGGGKRVNE